MDIRHGGGGTLFPGFLPGKLGTLTPAKGSEFWAFLFEGNKVISWEIHSILREKDFGESRRSFGFKTSPVPILAMPFNTSVALDSHLNPFIIHKMGIRSFSL